MKKLVSAMLILVMLLGCAYADDTKDMLSTIYVLYSMNNDIADKYIDTALMYFLRYQDEGLEKTLGLIGIVGEETYRTAYDGQIGIIKYICEKKLAYANGEMTKDEFTSLLFGLIKIAIEAK